MPPRLTRLTNGRVLRGDAFVKGDDVWVRDGVVIDHEALFWQSSHTLEHDVVDCAGCYVSPGLIDLQINGVAGVNFSDPDMDAKKLERCRGARG